MNGLPARSPEPTLKDRKAEIIDRLDVAAEFAAMGVEFTKPAANARGWRECRAMGREDRDPSASVNVETAYYKSHGEGAENLSLWDFAVKYGKLGDFAAALRHFSEKAGVAAAVASLAPPPARRGFPTFDAAAAHTARTLKGTLQGHWVYLDDGGAEVLRVARFATAGGKKTYRPFHFDPKAGWVAADPSGLLPLYGLPTLAEPGVLWLFEGEKVADLGRNLGLLATTSAHGSASAAKADWAPAAGRDVVICPDNDPPGEKYAADVLALLARLNPPPRVKVLRLPGIPEGGDLAEWLAALPGQRDEARARAELERLAAEAPAWAPDAATGSTLAGKPNEAEDDPHRLARLYRDARCWHADGLTMRFWRGEIWRWDGAAYRVVSEGEIRAELNGVVKDEFDRLNLIAVEAHGKGKPIGGGFDTGAKGPPKARKVTQAVVGNATQALASLALLPSKVDQPAWLGDDAPWPPAEILPAANGIVHLPSLVRNAPAVRRPTPKFFVPYALDYGFDPDAAAPAHWLGFLAQLWPKDPQSRDALQEWMGLCLTADTRFQKILAMIGPKRCGKGTIARILRALIGPENVAGPTLSGLAGPFGMQPLIGKLAAIVSDARLSGRTDQGAIVERLLSISGEDSLTVDRKHKEAWTGKLPTRFTLISNELPRLSDSSGALAGRLILLRFTHTFYGQEDLGLTDRLLGELPGILLWAIEGWRRLRERGHFLQPESGKELVERMEDLASPIGAFIREECEINPGHSAPVEDLFDRWKTWCTKQSRDHTGNVQTFGRDLLAALPNLRMVRPREGDSRIRKYEGIRPKTQAGSDGFV